MRNKLSVVLFTAFLFGMFLSASLIYAADNLHPKTTFHPDRAPKFMIPFERTNGMLPNQPGSIMLNMKNRPPTNSPGEIIGLTYYDYQHNGSMGRQVAAAPSAGWVFMVWMSQLDTVIPGDRGIWANAYNATTGGYAYPAPGLEATDPDYSGYTSCAWSPGPGDTVLASFASHVDFGSGDYNSTYYYDGFPYFFIFYNELCWPDPGADWYQPETIWPIMDAHNGDNAGVTDDVIYVLSHVFEGSEDMILYRKVNDAAFDQGRYMETVTDLSYTIAADASSDYVVVVYTDDMHELPGEGDGGQNDLDVYYMLSTDQGDSWGSPVCVSNYSEADDSLWRAYSDLSAVITPDGFLHIIAPVRELRSQSSYENYKSRLIHWDIELATEVVSKASVIDEARYNMETAPGSPCDPDAWNLYIAKPSVSYCDGKLYALYTKFGASGLNDCSHARFANGELMLAGSDTYLGAALGRTWDTAWNLTNTPTPLCDSSLCESDHWSSMGRYGWVYGDGTVKDTLDILYINDKDAGGIPQGSGTWTVNNVMHYRFECRDVAHIPKISLEPTQFIDPAHTDLYTEYAVTLKISNIGNEVLNISGITATDSSGVASWISLGTYDTPIDPQDFTNMPIVLNVGGVLGDTDPASYGADITINHDAPNTTPIFVSTVPIRLMVTSDFDTVEEGVLNTTCKSLMVYNSARIGGDNDYHSLDIPDDCDSVDTPPNEVMYLFDGSPMMSWIKDGGTDKLAYTTVFTQDITEQGTYRPQSPLIWSYDIDPLDSGVYDMAVCTVTTTDSLYGIAINLYAPNDGVNCFIIGDYRFFNWDPVKGAEEVYIGYVLDWDIPSDNSVDNLSGYDEGLNTIWQYGAEYDTLLGEDNLEACAGAFSDETNRLGGIVVLEGPDPAEPIPVLNAWTTENQPHQLGSGYDPAWLYDQMSTLSGYNLEDLSDSGIDLHTGLTFEAVDFSTKKEFRYVIGLITTNSPLGEEDYKAQIEQARAWAIKQGIITDFVCNCKPGDANDDGEINVGDAVYTINYVFKGGPAPKPYATCNGDGNGDCQCNVGDAVYTINYVFKGGPAPVTCLQWVSGCGQPIFK